MSPCPGHPRRASTPRARGDTHHRGSVGEPGLRSPADWGVAAGGRGLVLGCSGRLHKTHCGMFSEESKVGKGRDRKNQLWGNRGNRVKGGGWAWTAGRSGRVWPCPVLGACSRFWLLFKLRFYLLSQVRALYASVWVSVCAWGAECRSRGPWPTAEETTGPGGQLRDPFLWVCVCVLPRASLWEAVGEEPGQLPVDPCA